MHARILMLLAVASLLLPPAQASGQNLKPADRGPWEINIFAGGFDDDYEFDPDGSRYFIDPDRNVLFGAGLAYHFPLGLYLGGDARFVPLDIVPLAGGVTDLNAFFFNSFLGLTIPLHERLDIFGVGGLTAVNWRPEVGDSEVDFGFNYGGGVRVYLTEKLALLGEYRMHQIPTAMETVTESVTGLTADETFWGNSWSAGFSYFFGGSKDSDHDGVKDDVDDCPDTPRGVRVDARGCPVDSDGDGVADYLDKCPNTPTGARVNADGCPIDSDGDGVFDGLDRCPNTPAGATVDANGCPVDSDGDGVPDHLDRCPNTPRGTRVDANGCPLPAVVEQPREAPVRSYTFEAVNFEFDSARLTQAGLTKLREIGQTLVTIPDVRVVLEGHTDSVGTETYNMALSRRRAESVRDGLLSAFSQLRGSQFSVNGFGESQPKADNSTEAGRTQNRRVEIKIGG